MAHKGASKERDANFGEGRVAVIPHTAVKRVHELRFACEHSDGHAAGENFSVGSEVGTDVKKRLAASGMGAETGDNFVKDQASFGFLGYFAKLLEKSDWLEIRVAALNWLDQNCSEIACILANPLKRFPRALFKHNYLGGVFTGNAGGNGNGVGLPALFDTRPAHLIQHGRILSRDTT